MTDFDRTRPSTGARVRQLSVLVAVTVVGGLLGTVALSGVQGTFTSTASVLVDPVGLPALSTFPLSTPLLNPTDEVQVLLSPQVAATAALLARDQRPVATILGDVSVAVPPNTTVLTITVTNTDPALAQHLAQSFATAYLSNRRDGAQASATAAEQYLEGRLTTLQGDLQTIASSLAGMSATDPQRAFQDSQRQVTVAQISGVSADLTLLRSQALGAGSILAAASPPVESGPSMALLGAAAGGCAGLLLGVGLLLLRRRRPRQSLRANDAREITGLPVLADLTTGRRHERGVETDPIGSLDREVQSRLPDDRTAVLVVGLTGPVPSVSATLATAFAASGSRTLLLVADPDDRLLSETYHLPSDHKGVLDLLRPHAEAAQPEPTETAGLDVLGPGTAMARERLSGPLLERLVTQLRARYATIVVTGSPTSAGNEPYLISRAVDGVVLVVEDRLATRSQLADAVRGFTSVGTPVLGLVLVPPPSPAARPDRGSRAGSPRPARPPVARTLS